MINSNNYFLRLFDVLDNRFNLILNSPYVTGMGYGYKVINGKVSNIPTLTFLVEKKLSTSEIHPYHRIPKYVNGVLTDVLESGVQTLCKNEKRPAYAGLSVANSKNERVFGTITYAVTQANTKKDLFILSCSHVLSSLFDSGNVLTDVIQPAKRFGGVPGASKNDGSSIGALEDFTKIEWNTDKTKLNPIEIDAALAYVGPNNLETRNKLLAPYFKVGSTQVPLSILNTGEAKLYDKIWTITANTDKRKYGVIKVLKVVNVSSLDNKFILYKDQLFVEKTTESQEFIAGDSGSFAIGESPGNLGLGMLVSSSGNTALFTPINKVLKRLNVTLAKPADLPTAIT